MQAYKIKQYERKPFSKITKRGSINLFGLVSLIFAVGLTGVSFIIFQPLKSSNGQEKDNKQSVAVEKKNNQISNLITKNNFRFFIFDCTDKNKWIDNEVKFFALHNPYFVRRDFDGDGSNDYAITVENRKDKREGLLICFNNKENKSVLLGLDPNNPPPFWRLTNWDIFTPAEIGEI